MSLEISFEKQLKMYYKFITLDDVDSQLIFERMKKIISSKRDLPKDVSEIENMILFMLPRKEESLYKTINQTNIARILVSFIPTEPFEEIQKNANEGDPVKTNLKEFLIK